MHATGKIDVHHHMVPEFYANALRKLGVHEAAGAALPEWTPEKSLALMDATGIAKAYLSVSCPGVYFGDAGAADELARACNEYGSALKKQGDRFGFFATVSQTQTGWKHFVLKPFDPMFRKGGAGTRLAITITGTVEEPKFGLDLGRTLKGK